VSTSRNSGCLGSYEIHRMLMRSMSSRMIEPRQNSAAILDQTSTMLGLVQSIPGSITDLHLTISRHGQDQTEQGLRTSQEVRLLSMQVAEISTQGERTLQIIQSGGAQIVRAMTRLSSIMRDMRNLLYLYVHPILSQAPRSVTSCS
jgi:hypothetical protein